jgi:hypothetical protein
LWDRDRFGRLGSSIFSTIKLLFFSFGTVFGRILAEIFVLLTKGFSTLFFCIWHLDPLCCFHCFSYLWFCGGLSEVGLVEKELRTLSSILCREFCVCLFECFFFAVRGWAILCFAREALLENGVWRIVSDSALVKDLCFCSLRLSVMLVLIRRNSKRLVLLLLLPASER